MSQVARVTTGAERWGNARQGQRSSTAVQATGICSVASAKGGSGRGRHRQQGGGRRVKGNGMLTARSSLCGGNALKQGRQCGGGGGKNHGEGKKKNARTVVP